MGHSARSSDFSGALSAIVVIALIVATTALMLVALNTRAAAVAGLDPTAAQHMQARITTAAASPARPADRR